MSEFTDHKACSTTWMLFESGNGVVVDLSLHSPSGDKNRPIDAYVVTECEGGFTASARRAAEAVYDVVRGQGLEMEPLVVGYDLQGLPPGRQVMGESGGLAFAVALAKRLLGRDPGPVAATGEVRSGHNGGPVGPVRGIESKMAATRRLAPEGTWILYPKENDPEISNDLRKSLGRKGLRLHPVANVAEAMGLLFGFSRTLVQNPAPRVSAKGALGGKRGKNRGKKILILLLVCLGALLMAAIHGWPPFGASKAVRQSGPDRSQPFGVATDEKKSVSLPEPNLPHEFPQKKEKTWPGFE
jgi:hypothetical protein